MARARFLLTEALREVLRRHSLTPTVAARNAGLYDDLLTASFRGARCLSLDEIERVLDANNIPFEELLNYLNSACQAQKGPPDPVAILASFKEVPYPYSSDLRIWLSWTPIIGAGRAPTCLPELVKEIEAIRVNDRDEALERTRIWLSTFKNRLRGASRGQSFRPEAVCEFSVALGLWGSIAACLGLTNDAASALEHALRLHSKLPISTGYAWLLHWATALALPAGSPQSGIILAERALSTFGMLGDLKAQVSAMASLGAMKRYSGLDLEAAEIAGAILANPNREPKHCFAAHQLRLHSSLLRKDLSTANLELALAKKLLPELTIIHKNSWSWWNGRVEAAFGRFGAAKSIYCELLREETTFIEAGDRFLIFLDLVESLRPLQDFGTLRDESTRMRRWLPLLDVNTFNRAIILSFAQVAQQRFPDAQELERARAAVEVGARGNSLAPEQSDQPQGTTMSPSSGSSPLEAGAAASPSSPARTTVPPASDSPKNETMA